MRNRYLLSLLIFPMLASAGSTKPIRIPFTLENDLPTVSAKIDGVTRRLFIDSGGFAFLTLTKAALSQTPVIFNGHTVRQRDISGQEFEVRDFTVKEIQVGEMSALNIDGYEIIHSTAAGDFRQDGYIGFGAISRSISVFDYPHSELRLYPTSTPADEIVAECGGNQFELKIDGGVMESIVHTDKGPLIFLWDTGSTQNVLRPSALNLSGNLPTSEPFSKFVLGYMDEGRIRIPLREFAAPDVDGVLGTPFFRGKVVCFDPVHGRGWLNKPKL
jgi:hypothetical protein